LARVPRGARMRSRSSIFALLFALLAFAGILAVLTVPVATGQSTVSVSIQNFSFSPNSITVVVGVNNTVIWTNHDSVTHVVTADDSSFSQTLSPGESYTHTFTTAGETAYHCSIHTSMKGSVKVLAPSSSGATTTSGGSSGGIPEFPSGGIALIGVTAAVLVSYLVVRQGRRG